MAAGNTVDYEALRTIFQKMSKSNDTEYLRKIKFLNESGITSKLNQAKDIAPGDFYDIIEEKGNLKIKKLKVQEVWKDETNRLRKYEIGKGRMGEREKNIILVGATGAGKSTLIDAIVNYVLGVKWAHDYRLRIVHMTDDEKEIEAKGQAFSQTQWITVYSIPATDESKLDYTINVVDTPGFGDTGGHERDKAITRQVQHFFANTKDHGIDCVDGICFLVQAPNARLTPTQRYIFDSILNVFGKDIKENILMMITFCDGGKPPVIKCLKEAEVPFSKFFKFNNSGLFTSKQCSSRANETDQYDAIFGEKFWDLGHKSLYKFFTHLSQCHPKSLTLSSQVLKKRDELCNTVKYLRMKVEEGCQKINQLKVEKHMLEEHEKKFNGNNNYEYEVDEPVIVKKDVPANEFVTNCSICHTTCHENCDFEKDEDKKRCYAMNSDGNCTICEGACHWSSHFNQAYVFKLEVRRVKKTFSHLKEQYQLKKSSEIIAAKEVVSKLENEYKQLQEDVGNKIRTARQCISELNVTALKPEPLSDVGYIDVLIQEEKMNRKQGWQDRVNMLNEIKKDIFLIVTIKGTLEASEFIEITILNSQ